jgi:hypothetical protein
MIGQFAVTLAVGAFEQTPPPAFEVAPIKLTATTRLHLFDDPGSTFYILGWNAAEHHHGPDPQSGARGF